VENSQVFAAKVIAKDSLTKTRAKQKLMSEIKIHRSLHHDYIVRFDRFFEDDANVYILLELCPNQSMSELIRRRKRLTEIEVQCYCKQILEALRHLHAHRIIHRDLKLGNLFLSDKLEIKLGDFGLATKLEFEGERKRTVCGTPNYIAPEILEGAHGHSYEVDVWSFGVVLYTLLVGKPPFETNDVKTTYRRIKMNAYSFPDHVQVSDEAKSVITRILRSEPQTRPTLDEIAGHDFFTKNTIPKTLPVSTLAVPPSAHFLKQFVIAVQSPPLLPTSDTAPYRMPSPRDQALRPVTTRLNTAAPTPEPRPSSSQAKAPSRAVSKDNSDVWVMKWIDYSRKYGLGYLLSDGSFGVYFNDATKMTMSANGCTFYYIENSNKQETPSTHTLDNYPATLEKKVTLLLHFRKYLGVPSVPREVSGEPVYLKKWLSTKQSIVFRLSNKIVQVDFVDHTELILSSGQKLITYIDKTGSKHQFPLATAMQSGNHEMTKRLRYTKDILTKLMGSENQGVLTSR
jgi:polo-like kinase 1